MCYEKNTYIERYYIYFGNFIPKNLFQNVFHVFEFFVLIFFIYLIIKFLVPKISFRKS